MENATYKRKVQKKVRPTKEEYHLQKKSTKEKFHQQKESTTYHKIVGNFSILTFKGKGDIICLRPLFIRRKPFAANGSFSRFNLFSSDQKFC